MTKQNQIITPQKAAGICEKQQTVLVSGSFDIVHLGHLRFLEKAKALVGDQGLLIVIVMDDAAVKERKGPGRPVFPENYRLEYLTHLKYVDYVVLWKKPWQELRKFVLQVHPAFLAIVKGDPGEENKKAIIKKAGGKLKVFPKQGDFSTTKIINYFTGDRK